MSITIVSPRQYKTPSIIGELFIDDLPPECHTDGTLCGSYGTTNGPCRIRCDRGCLLLRMGLIRPDDAAVIVVTDDAPRAGESLGVQDRAHPERSSATTAGKIGTGTRTE